MADLAEFDVPEIGEDAAEGGISRRTLVKAGAVTAWTVPLIQVIAAAPAHAATSTGGPAGKLTITDASGGYMPNGKTLKIGLSVHNTGGSVAPTPQVTMTFSKDVATSPTANPGWTASGSSSPFTFTGADISNGKSGDLTASFTVTSQTAVDVTVVVNATGFDPVSTVVHVP